MKRRLRMKKHLIRLISLVLLVCLMGQTVVLAAENQYVYPNDWSRNALVFAVENGILKGNQNQDLEPKRSTTRAEMAAILVRLLGMNGSADLSAFKDVKDTAWYYPELSAAVAGGIFNGMSATSMGPNANITREQTMTVLCRAFGLVPKDRQAYLNYKDSAKISAFARDAISALQERGLLNGYSDGTLRPGNSITRAEVAQLIYNMFDAIVTDPAQLPQAGRVLYSGTESLPQELELNGTLVLGSRYAGEVGNWTVTDELILRCSGSFDLTGVTAGSVVCAAPDTTVTGTTSDLVTNAENVAVLGDVPILTVAGGSAQVAGTCVAAQVRSGKLILDGDVLELEAAGGTTQVGGNAQNVQITGNNVVLCGSGYADEITVSGRNAAITLETGSLINAVEYGLEGVTIAMKQPAAMTKPGSVMVTATFDGGTFTGPDTTDGKLICTLQWVLNGKVVSENKNFALSNGVSTSYTFKVEKESDAGTITVRLNNGLESREKSVKLAADFYQWDYDNALSTVKTLKIETTLKQAQTLYSDRAMTSKIQTLAKGTVVYLIYNPLEDRVQVQTAEGKTGWIKNSNISIYMGKVTHSEIEYSKGTVEGYVNKKGYTSETKYLTWISCYTQRVFVFEGSKGNWKLIKTFLVSTGDNNTPTPIGTYRTEYHVNQWNYDEFYVNKITVFHGGHAFHSILYKYNGSIYNDRVGVSLSHGCIRMLPNDVNYIYNLPLHTRVVVY